MQLRKMTELEQRMTDDLDWAEHAPEVQENPEHFGKFVVVYNKQILAVGKDSLALVEQLPRRRAFPGKSCRPDCASARSVGNPALSDQHPGERIWLPPRLALTSRVEWVIQPVP